MRAKGADTVFYDPCVFRCRYKGKVYEGEEKLTGAIVQSVDLVVVTTHPYDGLDYEFVRRHAKAVFDISNATRNLADRSNIETL